jgi:hypothetical protein
MHAIEFYSDSLHDETKECNFAEFIWPAQNKPVTCPSFILIHKNRQEDIKIAFDPAKCHIIFDELLTNGYIKLFHAIPSLEELKRRAYCKWHNSFSHAINDCYIFRWQVQSVVNEGRLSLTEMQVNKVPFLANILEK